MNADKTLCWFPDALLWEAWERVQENEGCAGANGVTIAHFARSAARNIERLMERVEQGTYRTFPLLTIVVEKRPEFEQDAEAAGANGRRPGVTNGGGADAVAIIRGRISRM